jgi:integrase
VDQWIDDADISRLLAELRSPPERAIALLMADGGLRVHEAVAYRPTSLNSNGGLRVFGKGKKWRTIPLTHRLRDALAQAACHAQAREWTSPIPYTTRWVWKRLALASRRAGLPHINPHMLRHSYATRLRLSGASLPIIQALLGHSNIVTTMIYVHTGENQLDDTLQAFERRIQQQGKL